MATFDITAFHATDLEAARNIKKNGFIIKHNPKHWLGNGVYFYLDESLAKWWLTKPSQSFGTEINNPAIINSSITLDESKILDLRKLDDYKVFVERFNKEFYPDIKSGKVSSSLNSENKTDVDFELIRCAYCNYLKISYEYMAIIGTFEHISQPYLPKINGDCFKKFGIRYIETQLCIFDRSCIIRNEIDKDYDKEEATHAKS